MVHYQRNSVILVTCMKVNLDYLARVEGEASIKYEVEDGRVKNLILNIWEPPRFFEGFLVGRSYEEVPDIVSRICGICPVSHMTTSILAIEEALGFKPSEEIRNIREIMTLSQIAASHVAHLFLLAMPDYYEIEYFCGLQREMELFLKLKEGLNKVTKTIGGRALHPISMVVGGFTKQVPVEAVEYMIRYLEDIKDVAKEVVVLVSGLKFPDFKVELESLSIDNGIGYSINEGLIKTSSGLEIKLEDYDNFFVEEEVPYSNAKRTTLKDKPPILVGALARCNIKFEKLHQEARNVAKDVSYKPDRNNPFFNLVAQAIEIVHSICRCIELLGLLTFKDAYIPVRVNEGKGISITEAPRGLLMHEYELDKKGIIRKANIVTPTAYNFRGIEDNLRRLIEINVDKPDEQVKLLCEMLVRAYDPCFSCSVH